MPIVVTLHSNPRLSLFRYSYSRSRGLFGGVSIEGSVIVERQDANVLAYKSPVTVKILLGGLIEPPPWATPLIKTLEACTGLPGNRRWISDEGNRSPGGSYAFGGVASSGSRSKSPFFFGRKKLDNIPFPPTSWGVEANAHPYFTDAAPRSHSRNMTWDGTTAASQNSKTKLDSNYDGIGLSSTPAQLCPPNPFSSAEPGSLRSERTPLDHHRNLSLDPNVTTIHRPLDEDLDDIYVPPTLNKANSPLSKPLIKPREELTRPLLPHEGLARAIALFNFEAVENGDLSFRKGDVIIITKRSASSDDWYGSYLFGRCACSYSPLSFSF